MAKPANGRLALVTGGNRGIGRATGRLLGERGHRVLLGSRDLSEGEDAARELQGDGLDVRAVHLDVTDAATIEDVRAAADERGGLDVLVNNAGVYLDEGVSVFDVDEATFRTTMEVNLYGPLRLCRAFVPGMAARGWGRVVNVTSGYGSLASMGAGTAAYRTSKAALNALTRIVAAEVDGRRVKVNAVGPGWVHTRMGGASAPRTPEEAAEGIVWAATLPEDGPTGGFFRDREPVAW